MEKISRAELVAKLNDTSIPIGELSQYYRPAPGRSRPFSPRFEIDPSKVELSENMPEDTELEGIRDLAITSLNSAHRKRREEAFARRMAGGWRGLKFVAEGDSWFQYPWRENDDLIDFLDDKYAILCMSAASDTFDNMRDGKERIAAAVKNSEADGLLFSGGGNDIVGDGFPKYIKGYNGTYQAEDYISRNFAKFLGKSKGQFKRFFNYIIDEHPDLKIFYHGYDRSFPRAGGEWVGKHLGEKEVPEMFWHNIISIMINRFNEMLKSLQDSNPDNIFYVDCRGAVGAYGEWRDELHADTAGCQRAALRFDKVISTVMPNVTEPAVATASAPQLESVNLAQSVEEAIEEAQAGLLEPDFENASEELLQEGDILPDRDIGLEDALDEAGNPRIEPSPDGYEFEAARGRLRARWPTYDENSTEYAHLSTLPQYRTFQFIPDDLERLIESNHFNPVANDGQIVFGLRGAVLQNGHEAENIDKLELKDVRPDHVNLRCVMGFYDFNVKRFWAYTASTVPNAKYMHAYYRKHNGIQGKQSMANMLPSGAYLFRRASHGWSNGAKKWRVPRALRLTNPDNGKDGTTIVLRTRNDLIYGTADYWDKSMPMDNIHPAYSTTSFSSAGCLTIRGSNTNFTNRTTYQWAKFHARISRMESGDRIGMVLLTGADAAIAAKLRREGNIGDASQVNNNIERLRIGSTGEKVKKLQEFLDIGQTGLFDADTKLSLIDMQKSVVPIDKADGIYSPEFDELFGANISSLPDVVATSAIVTTGAVPTTAGVAAGDDGAAPNTAQSSVSAPSANEPTLEQVGVPYGHADEEDMYPELDLESQKDANLWDDRDLEAVGPKLWYPGVDRTIRMKARGRYEDNYPIGAVVHSTEGRSLKGDYDARNTIDYGKTKGHCYFCISSTGKIFQPVPLDRWGYHSGPCNSPTLGRRLDHKLVGIEVCCAGIVKKVDGDFKPDWSEKFSEDQVQYSDKVDHITKAGYYHKFNDKQEQALFDLLTWLRKNNPNIFKFENVVGHDEVAAFKGSGKLGRKQDPGASLSVRMAEFRKRLEENLVTV